MAQSFVLLIQEPSLSLQRVVQVNGLPFTIGSGPEAEVCLRTPNVPPARIEETELGYCLCDGVSETPINHGSSFEVGEVGVRFFVGTAASLRKSNAPPGVPPASDQDPARKSALAYLDRLGELERKLAEIKPFLKSSRV